MRANAAKPATEAPKAERDEYDPEASAATAPIAAKADVAAAKAAAADVPAEAAQPDAATPPAPSLDPEIRRYREQLKQREEALAAREAELAKQKPAEPAVAALPADIEAYLDNAPSWLRGTFESMRGDKMTEDEFKSEVADLITMLSSDVLGVPLPENVRTKLEAAQAKKMVRTHKTILSRKEAEAQARAEKERAAATEKAEAERVEREWQSAAEKLTGHVQTEAVAKTYPWLAAEDDPGAAIVDVIRSFLNRDGTKLAWHEAAKMADDYLRDEHTKAYQKRQALFSAGTAPAAKPAAPAAPKVADPAPKPAVTTTPSGNQKWSREKHMENTRAAFRRMLQDGE